MSNNFLKKHNKKQKQKGQKRYTGARLALFIMY